MKRLRLCALLVLLGTGRIAAAQALSDHYSLGLRFGALIGQQRLASPPLPSLDTNEKNKFNLQGAYIGGQIEGLYYIKASDGSDAPILLYSGYARAYSGGLAYTSPSIGRYSLFAFGIYTRGAANFPINFSMVNFENSKLISVSGAVGVSYVLLGEGSRFKMGLFGGFFASKADTDFDYVIQEGHYTAGSPHVFNIRAGFTDFGPITGLQAALKVWKFSARSFLTYSLDVTDPCVDMTVSTTVNRCFVSVNSSVGSYGVSVGLYGFSWTIYSRVWGKIKDFDIKFKKYQLGYSLSL